MCMTAARPRRSVLCACSTDDWLKEITKCGSGPLLRGFRGQYALRLASCGVRQGCAVWHVGAGLGSSGVSAARRCIPLCGGGIRHRQHLAPQPRGEQPRVQGELRARAAEEREHIVLAMRVDTSVGAGRATATVSVGGVGAITPRQKARCLWSLHLTQGQPPLASSAIATSSASISTQLVEALISSIELCALVFFLTWHQSRPFAIQRSRRVFLPSKRPLALCRHAIHRRFACPDGRGKTSDHAPQAQHQPREPQPHRRARIRRQRRADARLGT